MQPIKKVTEGIYCGNDSFSDNDIKLYGITAIIDINGERSHVLDQVFNFNFSKQELLDSEISRFISKIAPAVNLLRTLREAGHNILVCCDDGKNLSLVIIGCYLVSMNTASNTVIRLLETIYLSADQIKDYEVDQRRIVSESDPDEPAVVRTDEENAAIYKGRQERRELLALGNKSFSKVINKYVVK